VACYAGEERPYIVCGTNHRPRGNAMAMVYDGESGELLRTLEHNRAAYVSAVAMYTEREGMRDRVVTGDSEGVIRVFDAQADHMLRQFNLTSGTSPVSTLIIYHTPEGHSRLAAGESSANPCIALWDPEAGTRLHTVFVDTWIASMQVSGSRRRATHFWEYVSPLEATVAIVLFPTPCLG
jgi:hypothetical protein